VFGGLCHKNMLRKELTVSSIDSRCH